MTSKFLTLYTAALLLITLSQTASAINCNQESPNLKTQGEHYYDINSPKLLTRKQKNNISKLFKRFKSDKLRGKGSIIECKGTAKNAKEFITLETIDAGLKTHSDGKIVIKLESFIKKKKVTRNATLDYFGHMNQYHIDELTDNKLIISYKLRNNKIFNEEITELSFNKNTLTIKTTLYIGGYFAQQKTRTLHI